MFLLITLIMLRFYSTLVRLKGGVYEVKTPAMLDGFYSTLVRLKALLLSHFATRIIRFYSTLVRLKVQLQLRITSTANVSIPHWCD